MIRWSVQKYMLQHQIEMNSLIDDNKLIPMCFYKKCFTVQEIAGHQKLYCNNFSSKVYRNINEAIKRTKIGHMFVPNCLHA